MELVAALCWPAKGRLWALCQAGELLQSIHIYGCVSKCSIPHGS